VGAVVGVVADGFEPPLPVVSLVDRFGEGAALERTAGCVAEATAELLATLST
jgi:hypothetical protein